MRIALLSLVILVFGFVDPVAAQPRDSIAISRLRVGLPAGPFSSDPDTEGGFQNIFKAGIWAPVWVDISANEEIKEPLELVVETTDADNSSTVARVPIPLMQKSERKTGYELGRIPYLKPGTTVPDIVAYVRTVNSERTVSNTIRRSVMSRDPGDFLVVSIGSSLNNFRLPKSLNAPPDIQNDPEYRKHRGGAVELAQCTDVGEMPDHWIGYSAFDVMVITTSADDKFWTKIKTHPEKMQAVAEWVRRGGRVIVSGGLFDDVLRDVPLFNDILPATIPAGGKKSVERLPLTFIGVDRLTKNPVLQDTNRKGSVFTMEIAPRTDRPDRVYRSLIPAETYAKPAKSPIVVQGTYGLGRVTIVGFDLDRPPFADWTERDQFWEWLLTEAGGRLPDYENRFGMDRDDVQFNQLNDMLDSFEGVPVISFGWVALFILLYIVLIGPVDYFFLKKVLKRLEWTWVTFPLIVIVVSAIAYYAAYAVKGRDQKINKIDFVDVDLQTRRVYGNTWFTIFSPRIQNYSIGVEPVGPEFPSSTDPVWTSDTASQSVLKTTVSWNSQLRESGRSLLQRKYRYHCDYTNPDQPLIASGLEEVPIQVWSTKSFTASWSAAMDPNKPLLTHTLRHPPGEPEKLIGSIISNFPVAVQSDVYLFYRDKVITVGQLTPGVERTLTLKDSSQPLDNFMPPIYYNEPMGRYSEYRSARPDTFGTYRLWGILFSDRQVSSERPLGHPSIRQLNQSWRIKDNNYDHAILVMRLPATAGSAEELSQSPASPTRLWLNELPGGPASRTSLSGTMRQETYVRVFIPIPRLKD